MSDPIPHSDDPKIQAKIDKAVHHNSLVDYTLRWLLHYIERIIAVMTILALLGALGVEIYHMIASGAAYFADVETMLHHILNIVVGLEFVRMLIDTTPANILECSPWLSPGMWCSAMTTPGAMWPALPVLPGSLPSVGSWFAEAS